MKQHLEKVAEYHTTLLKQVDTNAKDVKHAVYVIQGNALTRAFAAFAHSEKGDRVSAMQQSRFLQECLNWVEYLCFEKDTTRVLGSWFKGTAMTAPNPPKKEGLDEKSSAWHHEQSKDINHKLSAFLHPTRKSAAYNLNGDLTFDYRLEKTKRPGLTAEELANFIVKPAMLCVMVSHPVFDLPVPDRLMLEGIWHAVSDASADTKEPDDAHEDT